MVLNVCAYKKTIEELFFAAETRWRKNSPKKTKLGTKKIQQQLEQEHAVVARIVHRKLA